MTENSFRSYTRSNNPNYLRRIININYRINERIRAQKVRLIDQDGTQLGVVSLKEAKTRAATAKLDLVEIAPTAEPPVVKILDYGKFKYLQQQKEKEAKKHNPKQDHKEVRFRVTIEDHDFQTKAKQAQKFLSQGYKVKAIVQFKGRQISHPELGTKVMDHLIEQVKEAGKPETPPRKDGRNITVMLIPGT